MNQIPYQWKQSYNVIQLISINWGGQNMGKSVGGVRSIIVCVMLIALVGCAPKWGMEYAESVAGPSEGHALVTFLRASNYANRGKIAVWDGDEFIGFPLGRTYIQYEATPGEHLFMARAENWSLVSAEVEAGKHYILIVRPAMGAWTLRVLLDPVRQGEYNSPTEAAKIEKWLGASRVIVSTDEILKYRDKKIESARTAVAKFEDGEVSVFGRLEAIDVYE